MVRWLYPFCTAALAGICALVPLWFSDDWKRIYEGPEGLAVVTEFPGAHTAVMLKANDVEKLASWAKVVEAALAGS